MEWTFITTESTENTEKWTKPNLARVLRTRARLGFVYSSVFSVLSVVINVHSIPPFSIPPRLQVNPAYPANPVMKKLGNEKHV